MSSPDERRALLGRVRPLLPSGSVLREVSMFGGLSLMLEERMLVAAGRDGSLLVRIDPERHEELTGRPGAMPAEMGTGRAMGPGWIRVGAEGVADEDRLWGWVEVALEWHGRAG